MLSKHPPSAEPTATLTNKPSRSAPAFLRPNASLIDECVHCGFCLPHCPTYALWGEETDSPRGRIYLLKEALEGDRLTSDAVVHFDRCLGCMACVTACPSGVQYDKLILDARAQIEDLYPRRLRERLLRALIFNLFCYPRRLKIARGLLWGYQRLGIRSALRASRILQILPKSLRAMESIAPEITRRERLPQVLKANGVRRGIVGMLSGCVQDAFFSEVNAATARVLTAEGFDVVIPPSQGCCGALSAHSGRLAEAKQFARRCIDLFGEYELDAIIVNSAGCGSSMKEYGELFADEPGYREHAESFAHITYDVTEFLTGFEAIAFRNPLALTVAYHDACHLAHAQQVRAAPRTLLLSIPDLQLREINNGEICCGSAGVYNLVQPEAAAQLGERKAVDVLATGAQLLGAGNPGCLMQIATALQRSGKTIRTAHTIELLDASIRGIEVESLLA